jgi:ornithine carbamoyltransferase
MTVRVATRSEHRPEPEDLMAAAVMGGLHGGQVALVDEPHQAVTGADAIGTGRWPRPADPAERRRWHEQLAPYRVTPLLVERASARAIVLHHLPVHRGEEVRAAVVDHRQTVVWRQAANRVPVEQAIVYALSGGGEG